MGIVAKGVGKVFGEPPTRVLADIDLEIQNGEFVALTGRSGAGKSTLLYLLSSLDRSSQGRSSSTGGASNGFPAKSSTASAMRRWASSSSSTT